MDLGLRLTIWLGARLVGRDAGGNAYYEARRVSAARGRHRRWVLYAGGGHEATRVPPEWHAWLHYTVDAPLADTGRRVWWKPHLPNATGTALSYRPPGHDYRGGARAHAASDYEAWTPDA